MKYAHYTQNTRNKSHKCPYVQYMSLNIHKHCTSDFEQFKIIQT